MILASGLRSGGDLPHPDRGFRSLNASFIGIAVAPALGGDIVLRFTVAHILASDLDAVST